jgi:hypothetical protein
MRRRRIVLSLCCASFVAACPHLVGARGPGEIEVTGYGGQDSYHYVGCEGGPRSTIPARYGGIGVDLRHHPDWQQRPKPPAGVDRAPGSDEREDVERLPRGFALSAGVATEYVSAQISECAPAMNCGLNQVGKDVSGLRYGARATIGYDWRAVGIHAGASLNTPMKSNRIGGFDQSGFPELLLRFGTLELVHFDFGLGSYNAPTILRPGAFMGIGFVPKQGWDVALHVGGSTVDPWGTEQGTTRFDVALRAPVGENWRVGGGLSVDTTNGLPHGPATVQASF